MRPTVLPPARMPTTPEDNTKRGRKGPRPSPDTDPIARYAGPIRWHDTSKVEQASRICQPITTHTAAVSAFHRANGPAARPRAPSRYIAMRLQTEACRKAHVCAQHRSPRPASQRKCNAHSAVPYRRVKRRKLARARTNRECAKRGSCRAKAREICPASAVQPRRRRPAARQEKPATAKRLPPVPGIPYQDPPTRLTGIPNFRALSIRLSVIPLPSQAISPFGMVASI